MDRAAVECKLTDAALAVGLGRRETRDTVRSGIEAGIRKRLEGLDYTMASQGIMPDDRVLQWVLDAAGEAR